MARNLSPKCKQCRREGIKLLIKGDRCFSPKCAMLKRNYAPGAHGPNSKPRLSGYGHQLREKQKLKKIYGILEQQLKIYFDKSIKKKGSTAQFLLQALEMRLDNLVYRLGFVNSRKLARQLVSHGHLAVNGKKVNIPSYRLKIGDEISIKAKSQKSLIFEGLEKKLEKTKVLDWLELYPKELKGRVIALPNVEDVKQPFDFKSVVEFYSR